MPNPQVNHSLYTRDDSGNPICKRCKCSITDVAFKKVWFHPEYPSIQIGPYCEDCVPYFKLCTGCNNPFPLYEDREKDEITFFPDGKWYCNSCKENLNLCEECEFILEEHDTTSTVDGKVICLDCLNRKTFVCEGCNQRHLQKDWVADEVISEEQIYKWWEVFAHFKSTKICKDCFRKTKRKVKPTELIRCKICERDRLGISDIGVCVSCLKRGRVSPCNHCNTYQSSNKINTYRTTDNKIINLCDSCGDSTMYCKECHTFKPNTSDGVAYSDYHTDNFNSKLFSVCNTCSSTATICPTCLRNTGQIKTRYGFYYCEHCEDELNFCSDCMLPHMGEGGGLCRKDMNEALCYTYKPMPVPHLSNREIENREVPLILGIENEVSFYEHDEPEYRCTNFLKFLNDKYLSTELYIKYDSSIEEPGFEIVTHPMSLEYFKDFDVKSMFPDDLIDDSSCGMHIHINRSFFKSKLHLYKLVTFINEWDKLRRYIAGRDNNGYSEKIFDKISKVILKKYDIDRHSCVNLSSNKTIELRIFAGCTTEFEYRYRAEFTHAIAMFTKGCSIQSTEKDFVSFVTKRKKEYPNLMKKLNGYTPTNKGEYILEELI